MKEPNRLRTWMSALLSGSFVVTGLFLFCPPNLFHSRSPGRSELWEQPRYLAAVPNGAGELAISVQHRGKTNISIYRGPDKLTPVTSGTLDADPAWDPTGTRIAYVSFRHHGKLALRVHDLTKGSDTELLEQTLISQPQWSSDGKTIFFLRNRSDLIVNSTICALDLQTKRVATLTETSYNRPQAWGLLQKDQLVYAYKGAVRTKRIGEPSRRLPITLTNPCMVLASPNNRLLFVCDSLSIDDKRAILVDLSTRQSKQIYGGCIRYALWSPSGRFLAIPDKEQTKVFRTSNIASIEGWQLHTTIEGIAVCWHSESKLVLIRPGKSSPLRLEEVDMGSGASTRLTP